MTMRSRNAAFSGFLRNPAVKLGLQSVSRCDGARLLGGCLGVFVTGAICQRPVPVVAAIFGYPARPAGPVTYRLNSRPVAAGYIRGAGDRLVQSAPSLPTLGCPCRPLPPPRDTGHPVLSSLGVSTPQQATRGYKVTRSKQKDGTSHRCRSREIRKWSNLSVKLVGKYIM